MGVADSSPLKRFGMTWLHGIGVSGLHACRAPCAPSTTCHSEALSVAKQRGTCFSDGSSRFLTAKAVRNDMLVVHLLPERGRRIDVVYRLFMKQQFSRLHAGMGVEPFS